MSAEDKKKEQQKGPSYVNEAFTEPLSDVLENPTSNTPPIISNTSGTKKSGEKSNKEPASPVSKTNDNKSKRSGNSANSTYIDGCKLNVSILYLEKELFLMLTTNELSGVPQKLDGGHDFVRLSVTLLPEKKYRRKTKFFQVTRTGKTIKLQENFRFSNVTRESMVGSEFRIRLYAKKCLCQLFLGEMFIKLADVAEGSGGFITRKAFERKKDK